MNQSYGNNSSNQSHNLGHNVSHNNGHPNYRQPPVQNRIRNNTIQYQNQYQNNNQNYYNEEKVAPIYGIDTKGTNKLALNKAVKMFAYVILIMGIALISKGIYGKLNAKPTQIDTSLEIVDQKQGSKVTLKIKSEKPVRIVTYKWNDGEPTSIQGNNKQTIEQIITIPQGNNILKIIVTDYYGNERNFQKQYIKNSADSEDPTITIIPDEQDRRKIKIAVADDTQLSYITYEWDDYKEISTNGTSTQNLEITKKGEQQKIEIEKGKKDFSTSIDIPAGDHVLVVEAYDAENNSDTLKKAIKGIVVPEVDLSYKDGKLTIKANDETGISKIILDTDGKKQDTGENPINQKNVELSVDIGTSKHKATVTVINMQGQQKTKEIETGA